MIKGMKRKLISLIVGGAMALVLIPFGHMNVEATTLKGVVNNIDSLNVRQSPSTYSAIIGSLKNNDVITINSINGKWDVITFNSKTAYVYSSYVKVLASNTVSSVTSTTKYVVNASGLNVRSIDNVNGRLLGSVSQGTVLNYIKTMPSGWLQVHYNNQIGYVSGTYVVVQNSQQSPPASTPTVTTKYIVNTSWLNVRSIDNVNGRLLGSVSQGTVLNYIKTMPSGWLQVHYNNQVGYVSGLYVIAQKSQESTPVSSTQPVTTSPTISNDKYVVNTSSLNVRSLDSVSGGIIGVVHQGDVLHYVKTMSSGWYQIIYNNGPGYVSAAYVAKNPTNDNSNNGTTETFSVLKGKTIVLDAGHGGRDSGAIGFGLYEKNITMDVINRVKSKLQQNGVNVILTRNSDVYVGLNDRVVISNNSNADAFVSVHINSTDTQDASGVESYYYDDGSTLSKESMNLASDILNELKNASTIPVRGVRTANYYVNKYNQKPNTLVELGFISSPVDSALFKDNNYLDKASGEIVAGIADYFK